METHLHTENQLFSLSTSKEVMLYAKTLSSGLLSLNSKIHFIDVSLGYWMCSASVNVLNVYCFRCPTVKIEARRISEGGRWIPAFRVF